MSYALSLRGLGVAVSANATASASAPSSTSSECNAAGDAFTKGATYVGLTSSAVKKVVTQCCDEFKRSTGTAKERTKGMAECFARAAATAGAAAACVAGGITAPFAGVCGTIGAFMADRVMGYDKKQLAGGIAASIICSAATAGANSAQCFYAGAEVVGWVGDTLSPVIEGIFNPSAAADRVRAQRSADNSIYFGTVDKVREAQESIVSAWRATVNRIWDLFDGAFSPGYRTMAAQNLGFSDNYESIAIALLRGGVPYTIMPQADLARHVRDTYPACEVYGKKTNGSFGDPSPLCPPFVLDMLYAATASASGSHAESQIAAETGKQLLALSQQFFFMLPLVEAALATKIAVVAVGIKQQEALDQAANASRAQLASRAEVSAAIADGAAAAALKGSAAESSVAVQRAKARYDMALGAYKVLMESLTTSTSASFVAGVCASDVNCKRATVAVARAKAASELAVKNSARAANRRVMIGTGVAAGAAGLAYYFLRK